jgi:hypothetical protein
MTEANPNKFKDPNNAKNQVALAMLINLITLKTFKNLTEKPHNPS